MSFTIDPPRPIFRTETVQDDEKRAWLALEIAFLKGLNAAQKNTHLKHISDFIASELRCYNEILRAAYHVVKNSKCKCGNCPVCQLDQVLYHRPEPMFSILTPGTFNAPFHQAWKSGNKGTACRTVCTNPAYNVGCGICLRCQTLCKFLHEKYSLKPSPFGIQRYVEDYLNKRGVDLRGNYAINVAKMYAEKRSLSSRENFLAKMKRIQTSIFRNNTLEREPFEKKLLSALDRKFSKSLK